MPSRMTPNAKEKAFQSAIRDIGCPVTKERHQIQLHHVVGRSVRSNGIQIGHWYVLPLHYSLHDVGSNHEFNVTHHKNKFEAEYGKQSELFLAMLARLALVSTFDASKKGLMPPKEVIDAILDYR